MTRNECEAIRPLISAALDGELDEQEFVRLSEHLASCEQCRQVHREYYQLRDGIRAVDAPPPPPTVTRTIRQETVEKPPPSPIIRFVSRAGLRFGMSTAAASIVILIIASFFAYQGHQQMTVPVIAASEPVQESEHRWPINQPVKIHFSKQMDQASVEANLSIIPSSERERLPTSWDGNVLVIGQSAERSVLLREETDYFISVLHHAEDVHGNPIGETWTLSFRTGPRDVAVSTPSPERDPTEQESEPAETAETDDQEPTEPPPTRTPTTGVSTPEDSPQEQTDTAGGQSSPSSGNDDSRIEPPVDTDPEPTQPPEDPDPTPTVEPAPSETPEPSPETPTATAEPEPTTAPSPTPTVEPTVPPSPEPIAVRDAFGEVYWGNAEIEARLGKPTQPEHVALASEQEFQRGVMFRFVGSAGVSIYVFRNEDGAVLNFPDTWSEADGEFTGEPPSADLHVPQQHFGKVWAGNPESVAESIGFAISADPAPTFEGRFQQFENGQMIYSRGMVYVIFEDNTWQRFVDGNASGFQSDDSVGDEDQQEPEPEPEPDEEAATPEPDPTSEPTPHSESTPPGD